MSISESRGDYQVIDRPPADRVSTDPTGVTHCAGNRRGQARQLIAGQSAAANRRRKLRPASNQTG
jgi:hypothetical protein